MEGEKKKALITGITGQDGSYLAEHLLNLGYEVHGIVRRVAVDDPKIRFSRIFHILDKITLHPANLECYASLVQIFLKNKFNECYHLGAQSFVAESFKDSFATMSLNINSTHYLLECIKELNPTCRFYFAGTSESYGKVEEIPQSETTKFHPRSPYAVSKVTGFELTRNYREAYDMFSVTGLLFNHESPRRGYEFVTRKITRAVARIKYGLDQKVYLGNLDSQRDWGHANDYVKAMHLMLQQAEPNDFVIATGETHSVREFCELAFGEVGLDYKDYVEVSPEFYRPAEVDLLIGNPTKARTLLNWKSEYSFPQLVKEMVQSDMEIVRKSLNL